VNQRLATGFVEKGAVLSFGYEGMAGFPREAYERLILTTKNSSKLIKGLNELDGYVHIDTKLTALRYVRLYTSPATFYVWCASRNVEIVDEGKVQDIPNYGYSGYSRNPTSTGYMGRLSMEAFRAGGFAPPVVKSSGAGYCVTRWILHEIKRDEFHVQLWREAVGVNGKYSRTVLKDIPAPLLLDTDWYMDRFE
jgi:hypothetical protein